MTQHLALGAGAEVSMIPNAVVAAFFTGASRVHFLCLLVDIRR
jgi:hypothetical protein